jgi:UDP-glucose 4-epimerase
MKILVTGGDGFIARNLSEQLKGEFDVRAPGRRQLDLMEPERVRDYLVANRFDAVIHAATYDAAPEHSTKDPAKVLENNLRMFFSVARCREHFGKMIYFGSGAEFGRDHWLPKMSESYFDTHVPQDQYGFSKYVMTKFASASANVFNLRLFGVFGKYEDWRVRITSDVCHKVVSGSPIVINRNRRYDFLFVDDLVRIVAWFVRNTPRSRVYNVCTGEAIGFTAIAEKVLEIAGKSLPIEVGAEESGVEYSGDNALLEGEMGGVRVTPFDEAIGSLYRWYAANPGIFDRAR